MKGPLFHEWFEAALKEVWGQQVAIGIPPKEEWYKDDAGDELFKISLSHLIGLHGLIHRAILAYETAKEEWQAQEKLRLGKTL